MQNRVQICCVTFAIVTFRSLPGSASAPRTDLDWTAEGSVEKSISDDEFNEVVELALSDLPEELREAMDNVVIFIEDDAPEGEPDLLGLYEGIALTERDSAYGFVPPDTISLYKNNLIDFALDDDDLRDQIYITVIHEIAHHFGIDDDRLHELGWA